MMSIPVPATSASSAVQAPKRVSGSDKPKGKMGELQVSPTHGSQTRYGQCLKVLWKHNLIDPKVEIIKIMKETSYNVDAITSEGELRSFPKTDFWPLEFVDAMNIVLQHPKGTKLKILWKESYLKPKVEIIQVTAENYGTIDYYDSEGILNKGVHKFDMHVLEVIELDSGEPQAAEK